MYLVMYTNSVSAHQLPLARALVRHVGADNFRYVYTGDKLQGGGQEIDAADSWITQDVSYCEDCVILLVGGLRPIELLERRSAKGLKTFYQSERWFKPIPVRLRIPYLPFVLFSFLISGWLRMFIPSYRKMAKRFLCLMNNDSNFITLPIGLWARRDFLQLGVREKKMINWMYFVAPSEEKIKKKKTKNEIRILWVGRMLWWKRVDTIIKAVKSLEPNNVSLTLVGDGEEKERLMKMSAKATNIFFMNSMSITEIRQVMREHDVYVLSSNAMEGWGAALNEAIEEGMVVYGTYEAGASASMLTDDSLFHAGDWRRLAWLLQRRDNTLPRRVNLNIKIRSILET